MTAGMISGTMTTEMISGTIFAAKRKSNRFSRIRS
jgi:hypothetical protein